MLLKISLTLVLLTGVISAKAFSFNHESLLNLSFSKDDSLREGRSRDGRNGTDDNSTINGQNNNGTNGNNPNNRWDNQPQNKGDNSPIRLDTVHAIDSSSRQHNDNLQDEKYTEKLLFFSEGKKAFTADVYEDNTQYILINDKTYVSSYA